MPSSPVSPVAIIGTVRYSPALGLVSTVVEDLANEYRGLWRLDVSIWTVSSGALDLAEVRYSIRWIGPNSFATDQQYLFANIQDGGGSGGTGEASQYSIVLPYNGAYSQLQIEFNYTNISGNPRYGYAFTMANFGGTAP